MTCPDPTPNRYDDPSLRCTVIGCTAELYLTISSCIPLYREDPPWPGAGPATYEATDAVTEGWEIECSDGHKLWNHVDQIRYDNHSGRTDDDETGDNAPPFRPDAFLPYRILRLRREHADVLEKLGDQ